jgi:hypothetical protein
MTDKPIELLSKEVPPGTKRAIERTPRRNEACLYPSLSKIPCGVIWRMAAISNVDADTTMKPVRHACAQPLEDHLRRNAAFAVFLAIET